MYNLYALTRNEWKYGARDQRTEKTQRIETSYLAPDSVNEMFRGLELMKEFTGRAWYKANSGNEHTKLQYIRKGQELLDGDHQEVDELEILASGFENSDRKVVLMKVRKAYEIFKRMIRFYGALKLAGYLQEADDAETAIAALPKRTKRNEWINLGGQLVPFRQFETFRKNIHSGKTGTWEDVHAFYEKQSALYEQEVLEHAWASLKEVSGVKGEPDREWIVGILKEGASTMKWICDGIFESRLKDYQNPFRLMVYENEAEMDKVVGKLEENGFIKEKQEEAKSFASDVNKLVKKLTQL
jgi:hypothetical protein